MTAAFKRQNDMHTEDKKLEKEEHIGPILKHQRNHVSSQTNLMTTTENETFTKD